MKQRTKILYKKLIQQRAGSLKRLKTDKPLFRITKEKKRKYSYIQNQK